MIIQHKPMTEAGIPSLFNASKKTRSCKYANVTNQVSCTLFGYTMDNTLDMYHHCASCIANTKKPTTSNVKVRFS